MGTNYYVKHKERKVQQPDLHIGKSSFGWEFNFEGHEENEYYETPRLMSKKEWFEYLETKKDEIFDEYNCNIPYQEFIDLVNSKSPGCIHKPTGEPLLNHYDECKKDRFFDNHSFKDEEGFNISTTEFC